MTNTTPPPTMPDDMREAVARAFCDDRDEGEEPCSFCRGQAAIAIITLQPAIAPIIAAREDAAGEGERAAVVAFIRETGGPPDLADAIERNEHGGGNG